MCLFDAAIVCICNNNLPIFYPSGQFMHGTIFDYSLVARAVLPIAAEPQIANIRNNSG